MSGLGEQRGASKQKCDAAPRFPGRRVLARPGPAQTSDSLAAPPPALPPCRCRSVKKPTCSLSVFHTCLCRPARDSVLPRSPVPLPPYLRALFRSRGRHNGDQWRSVKLNNRSRHTKRLTQYGATYASASRKTWALQLPRPLPVTDARSLGHLLYTHFRLLTSRFFLPVPSQSCREILPQ